MSGRDSAMISVINPLDAALRRRRRLSDAAHAAASASATRREASTAESRSGCGVQSQSACNDGVDNDAQGDGAGWILSATAPLYSSNTRAAQHTYTHINVDYPDSKVPVTIIVREHRTASPGGWRICVRSGDPLVIGTER